MTVLKGGGHRLSEPREIDAILRTVDGLAGARRFDPLPYRRRLRRPFLPSRPACPDLVTPDALVCRALEAQNDGDEEAAAQAFEEAARASPDKDPKTARMYAAAGNLWIASGQPARPRSISTGRSLFLAWRLSSRAKRCLTAPAPRRRRTI